MDSFFSSAPNNATPSADTNAFSQAINSRFNAPDSVLFTPMPAIPLVSLSMTDSSPPLPPLPVSSSSQSPSSPSAADFITVAPDQLPEFIQPSTLVLDIRPYLAHSNSRLPSALSLSVPSTLLKRPNFSLSRLAMMLPSPAARTRFAGWPTFETIIVYDADSAVLTDSSHILGLLKKFRSQGFNGTLGWLKGGFQAVWRERRSLIDNSTPVPDSEDETDDSRSSSRLMEPQATPLRQDVTPTLLRSKRLPMNAFSISSTTAATTPPPLRKTNVHPQSPNAPPDLSKTTASNPFYDTIRQNMELEQGITDRIPLRLPFRVRRRVNDIPFPWLRRIARAARPVGNSPPDVSDSTQDESESSPDNWSDSEVGALDPSADPASTKETDALAMQFYRIELAEQRRLMMVMGHHTVESAPNDSSGSSNDAPPLFPFSITAGVEKGAKNRYRHIWPFEHTRVRLSRPTARKPGIESDDYVNASYVQPLGTNKRYIATQGPLEATFDDFWTLCWEQNVHVIVMLTHEVEGALVKCGTYWKDGSYGQLRLKSLSVTGATTSTSAEPSGFFTDFAKPRDNSKESPSAFNNTIQRVFELSHVGYPMAKPRKVIQLQFLGWMDMNVPDDPRGILKLVRDVEAAVAETAADGPSPKDSIDEADKISNRDGIDERTGVWKGALQNPPVLLHCSAGVGRTGGFITVDAVLDGLRREIRKGFCAPASSKDNDDASQDMLVDPASSTIEVHTSSATSENADPLPPTSGPGLTTMDVDEVEQASPKVSGLAGTRKWAEDVSILTDSVSPPQDPNQPLAGPSTSKSRESSDTPELRRLAIRRSIDALPQRTMQWTSSLPTSTPLSLPSSRPFMHHFPMQPPPHHNSNPEASSTSAAPEGHTDRTRALSNPSALTSRFTGASYWPLYNPAATSTPSLPAFGIPSPAVPVASATTTSKFYRNRGFSGGSEYFSSSSPVPTLNSEPSEQGGQALQRAEFTSSPVPLREFSSSPAPRASGVASRSLSPSNNSTLMSNMALSCSTSSIASAAATGSTAPPTLPSITEGSSSSFRSKVDYVEPRCLHRSTDQEPPFLSTYDDPIWSVLLDMREQRMSLVQTLRQYVFVHAAIIEGALQITDEESKRAQSSGLHLGLADLSQSSSSTVALGVKRKHRGGGAVQGQQKGSTDRKSSAAGKSSTTSSTGKRVASPTELPSEEARLAKRPSLKKPSREQRQNRHGHGKSSLDRSPSPRKTHRSTPSHSTPSRPSTLS